MFTWGDNLVTAGIPETPVKGFLNGKEVNFSYIILEKWRGSNDNVLIFSLVNPEQVCGFIEKFEGFQLTNKGNSIEQGDLLKSKFTDEPKIYSANYQFRDQDGSSFKSNSPFAFALKINSIDDKKLSGKIALTFNDEKKSWIAGKFEAVICNN
jgi:hypothetical protein